MSWWSFALFVVFVCLSVIWIWQRIDVHRELKIKVASARRIAVEDYMRGPGFRTEEEEESRWQRPA